MGDVIKTLVEKEEEWDGKTFTVPKGSRGLVCEVYEGKAVLVETSELDGLPFALVLYEEGEYEKMPSSESKCFLSKRAL